MKNPSHLHKAPQLAVFSIPPASSDSILLLTVLIIIYLFIFHLVVNSEVYEQHCIHSDLHKRRSVLLLLLFLWSLQPDRANHVKTNKTRHARTGVRSFNLGDLGVFSSCRRKLGCLLLDFHSRLISWCLLQYASRRALFSQKPQVALDNPPVARKARFGHTHHFQYSFLTLI